MKFHLQTHLAKINLHSSNKHKTFILSLLIFSNKLNMAKSKQIAV